MARQPRFVLVGHPQHVIIRSNNRDPIFYADADYRFYLEKLKECCNKHQCVVMANKGWVLGSDYFKAKITERINRQVGPKLRGGDRRSNKFKGLE